MFGSYVTIETQQKGLGLKPSLFFFCFFLNPTKMHRSLNINATSHVTSNKQHTTKDILISVFTESLNLLKVQYWLTHKHIFRGRCYLYTGTYIYNTYTLVFFLKTKTNTWWKSSWCRRENNFSGSFLSLFWNSETIILVVVVLLMMINCTQL